MNPFKKTRNYINLLLASTIFIFKKIFIKRREGMESKTKNRKTPEQIARMVERAFPGLTLANNADAVTELKEGWFNVVYNVILSDGREVILKIAPPPGAEVLAYEKSIMTTEVATMRMAAKNPAIPVPEIYYYDTAHDLCDSDYFFMKKLSGSNYDHIKKSLSPAAQADIDQQIGRIVHEINGFTGTYYGYDGNPDLRASTWKDAFLKICDSILEDGKRKNAEYPFSITELKEVIYNHSYALEEVTTPQLVHWDAWDLNFFVENGKISGILDFERAFWGDPLMEGQFRALAFGGSLESLKGYGKTTFTHEEDIRNHLYTLHLALVMKTECYYRNYDTDEVSNMAKMLMIPAVTWLQEN
jgi:aminoglycoside phosphotransferase (APT) family kinase protein